MVGAMTDQPPLEPDIEVPTHDEAAAIDLEPESRRWRAWVRSIAPQQVATFVLVTVSTVFVAWNVQPDLWFDNTTPTGGDMGAHVWSPAYLRDVLLPEFRLTGWSPDWYAGFPAFTFYMVIPSLLIVMVNVGLGGPFWVPVSQLARSARALCWLATASAPLPPVTPPSSQSPQSASW